MLGGDFELRGVMKRLLRIAPLLLLAVLLLVAPVLAYSYSAPITVVESGSNDYTMLPVTLSIDNDYLVDNGYISSSGLDTRVLTVSTPLPHMLADDKLLFASSIGADESSLFEYTFGNDALDAFYIIPGYDGYITISDDGALRLGSDFEVVQRGYIDTSAGSGKNLIFKDLAFKTYISAEEVITSSIYNTDWTTTYVTASGIPSGVHTVKTTGDGTNLKIYVDDMVTPKATTGIVTVPPNANSWLLLQNNVMPYMEYYKHYVPRTTSWGVAWVSGNSGTTWNTMDPVDFMFEEYDGTTLYEHFNTGDDSDIDAESVWWYTQTFVPETTHNITSVKLKLYRLGLPGTFTVYIKAVDAAHKPTGAVLTSGTIDGNTFTTTSSGEWYEISLSSYSLTANTEYAMVMEASGGDTDNNVNIRLANAGGYEPPPRLWYQPIDIIVGTALPDRAGTAQNGVFTWGSNPVGIAVSIGGLRASGVPPAVTPELPTPPDVLPELPGVGLFTESTGSNIPLFYPIFKLASDLTEWPIQIFWMMGALTLAAAAGAIALMLFHSLLLSGFAVGCVIVVACTIDGGIVPWWVFYVYIIMAVTLWVYQRVVNV